MHCPRCGAKNREENRYCVGCGSALSGSAVDPAAQVPFRERVTRLVGTTKRARLLSAATAMAILIAVGAFLALKPSAENSAVEDSFTRAADRTCVEEKRTIAALEEQTLRQSNPDTATFARALVSVVAEWHSNLKENPAPPIHSEAAAALDSALLDVLIRAGALARVAPDGKPSEIAAQAQLVDEASAKADRAIETFGLKRCASFGINPVS
jgi:hypothetical protein